MAIVLKDIMALAHGPGVNRLHFFRTDDTLATLVGSDYFNTYADKMAAGDIILCALDLDGSPSTGMLVVDTITAGVVVVVAMIIA